MDDVTQFKLQCKANQVLALEYDGSGDMWHYVTINDQEYGINIFDADMYGNNLSHGLCVSAYPVDRQGNTNFSEWATLKTEPLAEKIATLRLKLKGKA